MTLARIRVAFCSVVAALLAAAWTTAAGQGTPPGRETSAESVGSYALSQQMPVDPEVIVGTLPNGLRYYVRAERQAGAAAPSCGSSSRPDRCSKTTTSRGWRISSSTCSSRARGTSRGRASASSWRRSASSIGPDANAATSYDDTQYTLRVPTDVPGVLDRALLVLEDWAQAATFDPDGDRARSAASCSSEWRMHLGAGERTTDKLRQRAARRIALRGSAADRQARDHRARAARAAAPLLSRLVPPGPDGRDRRRRRRSRRGRRR